MVKYNHNYTKMLTVVVGNVVRDVNISIGPLSPHAASAGARVSISATCPDSNVPFNQLRLINGGVCKTETRCNSKKKLLVILCFMSVVNYKKRRSTQGWTHGGSCWLSPTVPQQTAPWKAPPQGWKPLKKCVHMRQSELFFL